MPFRLLFRVAALLMSAVAAVAFAAPATTLPFKHVYVIGDSLSDQGNLFYATTLLGAPSNTPGLPDANHYVAGRFSNGPNYVDRLAQRLGVAIAPSLLGGTNFAFGGARIDFNRIEDRPNAPPWQPTGPYPQGAFPWSIDAQRLAFLDSVKHRGADPTGLYIVFAGSNDLDDILVAVGRYGQLPGPMIQHTVAGIVDVVLAYKSAGARSILVPLMPNLAVVPSVLAIAAGLDPLSAAQLLGLAQGLSQAMNAALLAQLAQIDGPDIAVFDTFSFLDGLVANGAQFGFTNVTQPCYTGFVTPLPPGTQCDDPQDYLFWDPEHPTTRADALLADAVYATALQCSQKGSGHAPAHCAVNKH